MTPQQAAQSARIAGAYSYSYRPSETATPPVNPPRPQQHPARHPALPPERSATELLEVFAAAKRRGDLPRLREVCAELERGWSQPPVWQNGRNTLSSQRARLSPCVRYVSRGSEQAYYQAFLQAVLDPEYQRLAAHERS